MNRKLRSKLAATLVTCAALTALSPSVALAKHPLNPPTPPIKTPYFKPPLGPIPTCPTLPWK